MIQFVCLAVLVLLVVVRGPRAAAYKSARPAWWATVSGVIALSTYGFPIPFFEYDAVLGGQNVITLVRDLGATSAFWFFREALARGGGSEGRFGSRWGLAFMLGSYTIPFFFIQDAGPTEIAFIINRLDQTAVWFYCCAYMATLVWLAISTVFIALRSRRGIQSVFIVGFSMVTIGCLIEITFLTVSHMGFGGSSFRYSAWDAAELPFFAGLFVNLLGIGWVAVVTPIRKRLLLSRLRRVATRHRLIDPAPDRAARWTTVLSERSMIAHAHQLAVLASNAELRGDFTPDVKERDLLERARRLIAPDQAFRPRTVGYPKRTAA